METSVAELTREVRDKRVAVARDIIARLDLEKLDLCRGAYLDGAAPAGSAGDEDVQKHVDTVESQCMVCMLGAVLLSKARALGNVRMSNILCEVEDEEDPIVAADRNNTVDALLDVFDRDTLDLIECTFMVSSSSVSNGSDIPLTLRWRACDFGGRFFSNDDRARAIAQNLINNDGEFIIPASPAPTPEGAAS